MNSRYSDPLTYSTGRYAVVDASAWNIWITVHNEQHAHAIQKVFWSKVPASVFDLAQFKNWDESTVDSDVCLNWQVPYPGILAPLSIVRLADPAFSYTHTSSSSDQLINQPFNKRMSLSRAVELQQQMLLYKEVYWRTAKTHSAELHSLIYQLFQTELDLATIKEQLTQLLHARLEQDTTTAAKLLGVLGRLYA